MKIYISGPITGHSRERVEREFAEAEVVIRQGGHEPVNPLDNGLPQSATWHEHMRADLRMLLECDAILMIGNWPCSRGASIEMELAIGLGMNVYIDKIEE